MYFDMFKRGQGRDRLSPMTNALTLTEKSKKQRDNIKTPPKSSITQRLWTDLGRSVGETAVPHWCG